MLVRVMAVPPARQLDDSLVGGEANLTAGQAAMVALSTKQRKSQLALVTLKLT